MTPNRTLGKALVIGSGMAGLFAARVLSEYYTEVLVVERDQLPDQPENRPGTPQAYHPHRLLPPGQMLLEKYFPDFTAELLAHGAFAREGKRLHLINRYGSVEVRDSYDAGCSRALLEWVIRRRVQQLANVRFLAGQEVTGLLTTPDQQTVTGVSLRQRGQMGQPRPCLADLVVDASGRASKVTGWLQRLGYPVPPLETLKVGLGYSTRYYKIPAHLSDAASVILCEADPARGIPIGAFGAIEDNLAQMALQHAGGEPYPTTDSAHYEEEVAKLVSPIIAEELKKLEAVGEPRGFRVPESLRYHFEEMARWPAGLLLIGDAICNFDPVHGQGMTIAVLEAELMANALAAQQANPYPDFEPTLLRQMQAVIEPAWWLTLVADLRWQNVEYQGPLSLAGITLAQRFFDLYLKAAYGYGHGELVEQYFMMAGFLIPPRALLNGETVARLLADEPTDDPSDEAKALQAALPAGLSVPLSASDCQRLDAYLDQILPTFAPLPLPMPTMPG